MKRFITLIILLVALLGGISYALTLFDIHIEFRNDWATQTTDKKSKTAPAKTADKDARKDKNDKDAPKEIATAPQLANDLTPGQPANNKPGFDIIRIDPDSPAVFAGYARPHQEVAVVAEGKNLGIAKADADGNWVLVTKSAVPNPDAEFSVAALPSQQREIARNTTETTQIQALEPSQGAETIKSVNQRMIDTLEGLIETARATDAPSTRSAQTSPKPSTRSVPVPIQFAYRQATFTKQGENAARLLLEFLKVGKPKKVSLSGHADERGTHELNMELSRDRLKTVEDFLREGGYQGALGLIPRGETKPFTQIDRSKFSQDDLYQLDRRVELRFNE